MVDLSLESLISLTVLFTPSVLLDLLDDQKDIQRVQKVTLELELLIVMNAIEDVSNNFQKL